MASSIGKKKRRTASRAGGCAGATSARGARADLNIGPGKSRPAGEPLRRARGTPRRALRAGEVRRVVETRRRRRLGRVNPRRPVPPFAFRASGTGGSRRGRPRTISARAPADHPPGFPPLFSNSSFFSQRLARARPLLAPRRGGAGGGGEGGGRQLRVTGPENRRPSPRRQRRRAPPSRAPAPPAASARSAPLSEQSPRSLLETDRKVTAPGTLQDLFKSSAARHPRATDFYLDVTGGREKQRRLRDLPSRGASSSSTASPTTGRRVPSEPG